MRPEPAEAADERPRSILRDHSLRILLALSALPVMAGAIIAPVLPDLLEPLNTTQAAIGFVAVTHSLIIALLSPFMGVLSDHVGRRWVLMPSCLIYAVAGFAGGFVGSLPAMLATRALMGLGIAGVAGVAIASVGDLYDGPDRADALSYQASARALAALIFPLLGGLLGLASWRYPFFFYALGAPFAYVAWANLKDLPQPDQPSAVGPYLASLGRLVAAPRLAILCAANGAIFTLLVGIIVYMPLLLVARGEGSSAVFGLMFAVQSAAAAASAARAGKVMARFRWSLIVSGCFAASAVVMALIPLLPGPLSITAAMALFGLAAALAVPVLTTWVTELTPAELRGGSLAVFTTATYLGQFAAPVIFGLVVAFGSLKAVFALGAAISLAASALFWTKRAWLEETLELP